MLIMKLLLIPLLCCVAQVLGFAVQIPYESHGDLSMPGFTELNAAIMSGKLDLAPALSRLPLAPTDSLANVIKQEEMALSLDVLASVAPEFAELATIYSQEEEAWRSVFVMRDLGRSVLNLRTKLESTVEVAESPLTLLIQEMLDIINQFGVEELRVAMLRATREGLISAQDMADITIMKSQVQRLAGREAKNISNAVYFVMQASLGVHRALIAFQ
ncbi:hypothetical protein B566_EDAN016843 [Ephemera danica]|nr:hypothetical protein B566_EDAN016843 [Ephemera danica]